MTPPKCRICGVREHNHRCQGGTPAMRIEERQRLQRALRDTDLSAGHPVNPRRLMEGRSVNTVERGDPSPARPAGDGPPPNMDDGTVGPANHPPAGGLAGLVPPAAPQPVLDPLVKLPKRARWHDDTDAAGEPVEVRDTTRKPARFYAPAGQCIYCDRRREAARHHMSHYRERGER